MKNPYFEIFFKLIDKNQHHNLFKDEQAPRIDFLDYITILCRFLGTKELMKRLNQLI